MQVITSGRTDLPDYFKYVSSYKKLSHTPFLVFIETTLDKTLEEELSDLRFKVERYKEYSDTNGRWANSTYESDIKWHKKGIEELPELEKQLEKLEKKAKNKELVIKVEVIDNKEDLLKYPDETPVMGQWGGQWRSDFFKFKVGDFRKFIKKNI